MADVKLFIWTFEPKTAVDEALNAPAMLNVPATVEDAEEMNPPSNMERPDTARVDEAESAPVAATVKSDVFVESTKRRMSPVCESVVEARMSVPSVEVAKRLKSAFWLRAWLVVVVPTKMLREVVVGARKLTSMVSSKSHAWPICVLVSTPPPSSASQIMVPLVSVVSDPPFVCPAQMSAASRSVPPSILIPLPKVEVAVEPTSRESTWRPFANVEVAVASTVSMPAIETVEDAESAPPMVRLLAMVEDAWDIKPSPNSRSVEVATPSLVTVHAKVAPPVAAVHVNPPVSSMSCRKF